MEIKVIVFKEEGKYYTEDTVKIPGDMTAVYDIVDWLKANFTSYRGMHLVAMLDELKTGFPIMIPAADRQ